MAEEKIDWQDLIQIRMQLYNKLILKYGKLPSKKRYILEVIEDRGGMVSLELLSKVMNYKTDLLRNWLLKLNAEDKINIKGVFPNWKISLKSKRRSKKKEVKKNG